MTAVQSDGGRSADALGVDAPAAERGGAAADRSRVSRSTKGPDCPIDPSAQLPAPPDNLHSFSLLTASIVHELNQPLSGIATNASTCLRMLCTEPPNIEGARDTARRTLRDVNRAAELINRLRALFTERGHRSESVDLHGVVREVLAACRSEVIKARVSVRRSLADDMPRLMGDCIQLQQVIQNLVRNAIEAMAGGARCHVRKLTIATHRHANGHALLSVHDTGVGIPRHEFNNVFRPFYSTKPEGMGIGLCISRSIAERHGGRLWVTANDGPGVTFWLSIPCTSPARFPADMDVPALSGASSFASYS